MGFKSVYHCLQEVFPQIDARILKAVAIEHPKDVDEAVNDILTEVLPLLTRESVTPITTTGSQNGGVEAEENSNPLSPNHVVVETQEGTSSEQRHSASENSENADHTNDAFYADSDDYSNQLSPDSCNRLSPNQGEAENESEVSNVCVANDGNNQLSESTASEEEQTRDAPECDGSLLNIESSVAQLLPPFVQNQTQDAPECGLQSEFCPHPPVTGCVKLQASNSLNLTSQEDSYVTEMGDIEDELSRHDIVTRPGQVCRIDILDEIIEEDKNSKRTLFIAMESVINMIREVELQEKAAEHAKEEAAKGGLDILIKVDELKQMLAHAKEANDMHAGEVYGEKAILATEARELQARLLNLSDERDTALATLEEMHQTLEARFAAAEEVRKAAEQEKLEKEDSARKALAEQEAIMEKVVQESKLLQQEAEENTKLQEFLLDRGRIVDTLQGEISVICLDVRLLKEKFDERVPLSESLSSNQTSCILASSGSSLKSMAHDSVSNGGQSSKLLLEKASLVSSIIGLSPKSISEEDKVKADHKELLEDGWDIFEKDIELDGGGSVKTAS
ncbi:hypothetical protein FNV43_RR23419 [Rhamnella rubrinervis]|uniref:CUE domain-containing protein n=1 Tax=Rhamnella rubrinervis TaxID=2594499 RepID=A0A8K0E3S0_9ROSA|nr:hypothetical protein FNV43_RR23419 [Rhamnella rubrinervis]